MVIDEEDLTEWSKDLRPESLFCCVHCDLQQSCIWLCFQFLLCVSVFVVTSIMVVFSVFVVNLVSGCVFSRFGYGFCFCSVFYIWLCFQFFTVGFCI